MYRRRQHVISLTATKAIDALAEFNPASANGYNIIKWVENGVTYWAVSDLNASELKEFATRIRMP